MMRRIMVDFLQVFLFVFPINSAFGDTVTFNSEVQEGPESHNEAQQNVNPIDLYTKGMDLVDAYEGDSVILEEARNYFQTVLNEYPASPYGYLGMSEIAQLEAYQSWIDFDKASMEANALPLALKARELAPDFYEVHDRLANVYRALHQFDVAEKEVNTAIGINPASARSYITKGHILRYENKYSEAISSYEKAFQHQPTENQKLILYKNIGQVYHGMKNDSKALENYKKALEIREESPWVYNDIGLIYEGQQRFEEALANYDRACEIVRFGACVNNRLRVKGLLAEGKGDLLQAIGFYQEAVVKKLADAWILNRLGYLHLKMKDYKGGKPFFQQAVEKDGRFSAAYHNLGLVALDYDKDYKAAVDFFQKAIELDSNFAYNYYQIGRAFQMQNQMNEALNNYKKFMAMEPNSKDAIWLRKNIPPLSGY